MFSSSPAFAVGAPNFIPDGPHPRIWLTSSELSTLAAQRDASNSKWVALVSWCDNHISDAGYNVEPANQETTDLTTWGGNNDYTAGYRMSGWATHLYSYALAYQVLKQPGSAQNVSKANTYAARARTLLVDGIATALRAGEENNGLRAIRVGELHDKTINASEATALGIGNGNYKDGYAARFSSSIPIAYDWIYDTLSTNDKTLLNNMLLRWYDWTKGVRSTYNNGVLKNGIRYHEDQNGDCSGSNNCTSLSGAATQGYAWKDIGNNFGGGQASLLTYIIVATYGDYAESSSYLTDIKSYLSTYVISPLESDLQHSGGDSPEGWNYGGGFVYSEPALYGYYTATGDTAIPAMNWPKALVRASFQRASGDYLSVPMWGYWTGTPEKVNRINSVNTFVGIEQKLRPTSNESKMGQYLLDNSSFNSTWAEWQNLFYNSTNTTASSPIDLSEPLSYVAKGNGLYSSRSSWDKSNAGVLVTARLEGKVSTSHEGYDEGHISLLRGPDVLLGHQNNADAPPSVSFNTIIFNNQSHHAENPTQTTPSIDRYIDTADYSYVSGDITNSYKREWDTDRALLFRRSLLHIRPNVVVVYDITRSNSTVGYLKDWYTQYEADPTETGNTITVTNGASKGFVTSLYPSGSFTETNQGSGFYRVKFTPTVTQEYDQFLHVIEATGSAGSKTTATLVAGSGGRGALVGNTVAMFTDNQSGTDITTLAYTADATTHYISDLPINASVEVFRDGVSIGAYSTGGGGVITFSADPGAATYTIGYPVGDPCTDGTQNGDETGVDCGGSCPNACSTPGVGVRPWAISGRLIAPPGRPIAQ